MGRNFLHIFFYVYSTTMEDEKSCIKNTFIGSIVSYVTACCSAYVKKTQQEDENCLLKQWKTGRQGKISTNSAKVTIFFPYYFERERERRYLWFDICINVHCKCLLLFQQISFCTLLHKKYEKKSHYHTDEWEFCG